MYSRSKKSTRKGTNKTSRHKMFHDRVMKLGCMIVDDQCLVTLHHIYGAKSEVKTLENGSVHVGEYAVIPLHPMVHLYQCRDEATKHSLFNLHGHKKQFVEAYGTELELLDKMRQQYNERWPDCEYIDNAIIDLILETG